MRMGTNYRLRERRIRNWNVIRNESVIARRIERSPIPNIRRSKSTNQPKGRGYEIEGERFGRLTVIRKVRRNGRLLRECKCDCGEITFVNITDLRKGKTKSCGCLRRELLTRHGMTGTRFYSVWGNMISRCTEERYPHFHYYGGRGIKVCDSWRKFDNFKRDMFESYEEHAGKYGEKNTTLERIDVDGDYEVGNVKWATMKEQSKNKRPRADSRSGYPGVNWYEPRGKWRARVTIDYKDHHIGLFDTIEEAVEAREKFISEREMIK